MEPDFSGAGAAAVVFMAALIIIGVAIGAWLF